MRLVSLQQFLDTAAKQYLKATEAAKDKEEKKHMYTGHQAIQHLDKALSEDIKHIEVDFEGIINQA